MVKYTTCILAIALMIGTGTSSSQPNPSLIARGGWVSGYFPSWSWQANTSKNKIVQMNCFTHILFVAGSPNGTGIFWNPNAQSMLTEMVPTMHANNIKCILQLCCGWSSSMSTTNRRAFITSLLNAVTTYNMDGIDIDDEPTSSTIGSFAHDLTDSMTARYGAGVKQIITYASPNNPSYFASPNHTYFDQINVQGYDLVSPSWSVCSGNGNDYHVSWHQGPCYAGGALCPVGNRMVNLNDLTQAFVTLGIPKNKLGLSARPNGSIWKGGLRANGQGITGPLQSWTSGPNMWNDMPQYYWDEQVGQTAAFVASLPRIHDAAAGATYLSYDGTGSSNDFFISYDDGWACVRKVQLVQDSLYGGVYVWTIDGMEQIGSRYPQADSLKAAANRGSGSTTTITGTFSATPDTLPVGGGNATLTWTSQNATSASISPGIGTVPLNGNRVVTISMTTTFTLTLSNSAESQYYNVTVAVATPPSAPVLAAPANGATGLATSLPLMWNAPTGATTYYIQCSVDSMFSFCIVNDSGVTASSFQVHGLSSEAIYWWRVRASNIAGPSTWSAIWKFSTGMMVTSQYHVNGGWNLVSLPLTVGNPLSTTVYPTSTSYAFAFSPSNGLVRSDTLVNGVGYWLRFGSTDSILMTGAIRLRDTIDVHEGWNLIGSITNMVPVDSITQIPSGIVQSVFYSYNGVYYSASIIEPSKSYWVKVSSAGKLVLSASGQFFRSIDARPLK